MNCRLGDDCKCGVTGEFGAVPRCINWMPDMDQYPRGKLKDDDEGALTVAISTQDRTVIIDFGKPTVWIGMDKIDAIAFARAIIKHAEDI